MLQNQLKEDSSICSPAQITHLPDIILPNRLAPNVAAKVPKNPLFVFLLHFQPFHEHFLLVNQILQEI